MELLEKYKQRILIVVFFGALLCAFESSALAKALEEFYRGVRAMGMGNAFTAISDDEDAVFYNPAGIGLNRRMELRVNPKVEISADDLKLAQDLTATGSGVDADTVSKAFGKNIYAKATAYPSIYLPFLTLGYYMGAHMHFVARNLALPTIEASYIIDRGIVGGFGFEIPGILKKHFLRSGITIKWITRQGFDQVLPIASLAAYDRNFLNRFKAEPATGIGANLGLQYEIPLSKVNDIIVGTSWLDIGDTTFGKTLAESRPPSIRNNLTAGAAFVRHFGNPTRSESGFRLSLEGRHLSEKNIDPRLKFHTGMEVQIEGLLGSMFGFQLGWNQDSWTAGTKISFLSFDISAVTYTVENHAAAFLNVERRYMAQGTWRFDLYGKKIPTERDKLRKTRPRSYGN